MARYECRAYGFDGADAWHGALSVPALRQPRGGPSGRPVQRSLKRT
jgi:hypothetical protein